MKYNLKEEYKNKTITFKPNNHTSGISVNLWNINDTMAELLINRGYGHLFDFDEVVSPIQEESVTEEEFTPLYEETTTQTTTDCGCKNKTRRKPKKW